MPVNHRPGSDQATGPEGMSQKKHPIKVAALGVDQRTRNALEFLFGKVCMGRYQLSNEESADITLIDLDAVHGREYWVKNRSRIPARPAILLSINEQTIDGGQLLRKPLRPNGLLEELSRLTRLTCTEVRPGAELSTADATEKHVPSSVPGARQSEDHKTGNAQEAGLLTRTPAMQLEGKNTISFIGTSQDIDPSNPREVAKAQFDPERYLLGKIVRALNGTASSERAIRLVTQLSAEDLEPRLETASFDLRKRLAVDPRRTVVLLRESVRLA